MDAFNVFNHPALGFNNNQNGGTCIDCPTPAGAALPETELLRILSTMLPPDLPLA